MYRAMLTSKRGHHDIGSLFGPEVLVWIKTSIILAGSLLFGHLHHPKFTEFTVAHLGKLSNYILMITNLGWLGNH